MNHSVYIGGLPNRSQEEIVGEVRRWFGQFGVVRDVTVRLWERRAWVHYWLPIHAESATRAHCANRTRLFGAIVRVASASLKDGLAIPKAEEIPVAAREFKMLPATAALFRKPANPAPPPPPPPPPRHGRPPIPPFHAVRPVPPMPHYPHPYAAAPLGYAAYPNLAYVQFQAQMGNMGARMGIQDHRFEAHMGRLLQHPAQPPPRRGEEGGVPAKAVRLVPPMAPKKPAVKAPPLKAPSVYVPPVEPAMTPQQILQHTVEIFPEVDRNWVEERVKAGMGLADLNVFICDNPKTVPKLQKPPPKRKAVEDSGPDEKRGPVTGEIDYLAGPFHHRLNPDYCKAAERRLSYDFPQMSLPSLRSVLEAFGNNYVPAYAALSEELKEEVWLERATKTRKRAVEYETTRPLICDVPGDGFVPQPVLRLRILAQIRRFREEPTVEAPLAAEVAWIQRHFEEGPHELTSPEEEMEGALEECGICCEELDSALFVECANGHRYCSACIRAQARETALGLGGGQVHCLEHGCMLAYGRPVLSKVLEADLLRQVEEAAGEQALAAAGLAGLERCKWCNWGAVMETPAEVDKVFRCGNEEGCGRAVCRLCGKDWDEEHMGRPCREVESDAEVEKRKRLEEALTAAVVRRCHKCALPFQKAAGCNKMTCTCGATSCYLCRAPDVDYTHFCQHPREPGRGCENCKRCSLFIDAAPIDDQRLDQVRQQITA